MRTMAVETLVMSTEVMAHMLVAQQWGAFKMQTSPPVSGSNDSCAVGIFDVPYNALFGHFIINYIY